MATSIRFYNQTQIDNKIAGITLKSPQPLTFTNNIVNGVQNGDIIYVHIVDANGQASSVTFIKQGSAVTRVATIGTVMISFDPTSNVISLVDTSTSTSVGITSLFGYYIRP